jgi:hypothetical protein
MKTGPSTSPSLSPISWGVDWPLGLTFIAASQAIQMIARTQRSRRVVRLRIVAPITNDLDFGLSYGLDVSEYELDAGTTASRAIEQLVGATVDGVADTVNRSNDRVTSSLTWTLVYDTVDNGRRLAMATSPVYGRLLLALVAMRSTSKRRLMPVPFTRSRPILT